MKVIFLDIDGVLNSRYSMEQNKDDIFPDNPGDWHVKCLNYIIKMTDAKVVISSSWRKLYAWPIIYRLLVSCGFKGEVIDETGTVSNGYRGSEIKEWLDHNSVDSFVILDDDSDMEPFMDKHVKTTWEKGLTSIEAHKAIDILNKGA